MTVQTEMLWLHQTSMRNWDSAWFEQNGKSELWHAQYSRDGALQHKRNHKTTSSSSTFPAISLGFTILGEIFAYVTVF